jgi:septal ring factor EnvC (AmiA/AmiB activator)
MLKLVLGSIARQVGSVASGWLIAHGLAEQTQSTEIATVVAGIVVYAAMQGWSLLHKSGKVSA